MAIQGRKLKTRYRRWLDAHGKHTTVSLGNWTAVDYQFHTEVNTDTEGRVSVIDAEGNPQTDFTLDTDREYFIRINNIDLNNNILIDTFEYTPYTLYVDCHDYSFDAASSREECPPGLTWCWDDSCVDEGNGEECPEEPVPGFITIDVDTVEVNDGYSILLGEAIEGNGICEEGLATTVTFFDLGSSPRSDSGDRVRRSISTVRRPSNLGLPKIKIPDSHIVLEPVFDGDDLLVVMRQAPGTKKIKSFKDLGIKGIEFEIDGLYIDDKLIDSQKKYNNQFMLNKKESKEPAVSVIGSSQLKNFVTHISNTEYGSKVLAFSWQEVLLKNKIDIDKYPSFKGEKSLDNKYKILFKIKNFKVDTEHRVCIKNIIFGDSMGKNLNDTIDVQGACLGKPNKLNSPIEINSNFDFEYYIPNQYDNDSVVSFSSYNCSIVDEVSAECTCLSSHGKSKISNRLNPMVCEPGTSYLGYYDYIWSSDSNTGEFNISLEDGVGVRGRLMYSEKDSDGNRVCTNSLRIEEDYCNAIFGDELYNGVYCSSSNIKIDKNPHPKC